METKKIVFKKLSKVLSENEMKHITGGYGGNGNCCYYKCGDPWFEGMTDLNQDACWDKMERECYDSFTIQPC